MYINPLNLFSIFSKNKTDKKTEIDPNDMVIGRTLKISG